jgi:hypothetical protein
MIKPTLSTILLAVSCWQLHFIGTESFKTIGLNHRLKGCVKKSGNILSIKSSRFGTANVLYANPQLIEEEKKKQDFNTDAIIPKERWDFADDIYLITTTEKGSQRLERTKEQLEKVNMLDKVKIRTFKPDDEDRVRGKNPNIPKELQNI